MGKSTTSCFKIITCGSSTGDSDEIGRTESKASSDKRGWSFRKKSDRHRVLSNSVISEPIPSTGNKGSPEAATDTFVSQTSSTPPEKIPVASWTDEKPVLSSSAPNLKAEDSLVAIEDIGNSDCSVDESVVIVIQTAIRGYLAEKELCKLKNIIKLQAAVRGHLVRRQAVGTLRCVQAIVKMQALVRARHVRLSKEGLAIKGKLGENTTDGLQSHPLKEVSGSEAKVFTNGFARLLLESTPKTKPIHIKCDTSKPSSGWNWLERWMAASSKDIAQSRKPQLVPGYQEHGEKTKPTAAEAGPDDWFEVVPEPGNLKPSTEETANVAVQSFRMQHEETENVVVKSFRMDHGDEENLVASDADGSDSQACHRMVTLDKNFSSSSEDDTKQAQTKEPGAGVGQENSMNIREVLKSTLESLSNQTGKPLNANLPSGLDSVSDYPKTDREDTKGVMKKGPTEQLENDGKKFLVGTRKACNPAFAAVQSKFEELSSKPNSGRTSISGYHEFAVEPRTDISTKDHSLTEDSVSCDPRAQTGGSECSTGISISSTLDSPFRSEAEGEEFVHETRIAENENSQLSGTGDIVVNPKNPDTLIKNSFPILETPSNPTDHVPVQPEKVEAVHGNFGNSVSVTGPAQTEKLPVELTVSDMQIQLDSVGDQQVYKSSPEGSPRSHITIPESRGTPSSQISTKSQSSKAVQKGRSRSVSKKSPSNQNTDSDARSSVEHLPKDPKNGRRRNSFGSARSDHIDHEQSRGTGNPLPNYMQTTESAKAKAHPNISPRSSPDVQEREFIKKRHSLPTGNGKQNSPRMQILPSHGAKGNGSHSPHSISEKKWIR